MIGPHGFRRKNIALRFTQPPSPQILGDTFSKKNLKDDAGEMDRHQIIFSAIPIGLSQV